MTKVLVFSIEKTKTNLKVGICPKGGKDMNKYELLYIISSSATDEQKEETIKKVTSMIESRGGAIEGTDKWGMRKFAYPIDFKNEGYYVLVNFSINPEIIKEINNLMNITDNVVRQIFVKK